MVALLLLHLPHPSEAARPDLVQKLIVTPVFLFEVDGLAFKRSGDVRVIIADDGGVIAVLLDGLLQGLGLGRGGGVLGALDGLVGLGTGQNAHRFGDVHVQGELQVDFLVLLVDLKE